MMPDDVVYRLESIRHRYGDRVVLDIGEFAILRQVGAHVPLETYRSVWTEYGNVATASLPVGMWHARQEGRLARGNQVAFYCPAAGVQAGLMFFRY